MHFPVPGWCTASKAPSTHLSPQKKLTRLLICACDGCGDVIPPALDESVLKAEPGPGPWCGRSLRRGPQEAGEGG